MSSFQITVSPVVNAISVEDSSPVVEINGTVSTATGAAGGDLAGNYPNPTVDGLQGRALASTAPTNGQAIVWNTALSQWEPGSPAASVADGDKGDITVSGGGGTWTIDAGAVTETKIGSQAVTVSKIANDAVQESKIQDGAVTQTKIGTSAVVNTKIAAKSVSLDKILDTASGVLLGRASLGTGSYENLAPSADFFVSSLTSELQLNSRSARSVMGNPTAGTAAPADIVAASDGEVLRRSGTTIGFGTIATAGIADDAVTYAKIQNVTATDRLLGRSTSGAGDIEEIVCTAFARGLLDDVDSAAARKTIGAAATSHTHTASEVSAAGSSGQVMFNSGGAFAGDAGLTYDSATDTLTVGTAGSGAIVMGNGEFIRNTVDGRIDIMPSPHPTDDYGFYVDMKSSPFYVLFGTIDSAGNLNTNQGIQFQNTLAIVAGKALDFGNTGGLASYYAQSGGNGAWYFAPYIGSGNAGALCLVSQNAQGVTNRRPTTAHTNPTLYVYAAGTANANDFVRTSHDGTDGAVEAGRGKLRLKGASGARVESSSGGFDLPATAGINGQVLTTDGTNASWQTPTGGGLSEDDVVALAVAL